MDREARHLLLELIRRKLDEVVDAQSDFQHRTADMLGTLMALHVFDASEVDMVEKERILNLITHKLLDVKRKNNNGEQSVVDKKELLELYKLFLK